VSRHEAQTKTLQTSVRTSEKALEDIRSLGSQNIALKEAEIKRHEETISQGQARLAEFSKEGTRLQALYAQEQAKTQKVIKEAQEAKQALQLSRSTTEQLSKQKADLEAKLAQIEKEKAELVAKAKAPRPKRQRSSPAQTEQDMAAI